jgi:hypothetical protein
VPAITHLNNSSWPDVAAVIAGMEAYFKNQSPVSKLPNDYQGAHDYTVLATSADFELQRGDAGTAIGDTEQAWSEIFLANDSAYEWSAADEMNQTERELLSSLATDDSSFCRALAGGQVIAANTTRAFIWTQENVSQKPTSDFMLGMGDIFSYLKVAGILMQANCTETNLNQSVQTWATKTLAKVRDLSLRPRLGSFPQLYFDRYWISQEHGLIHATALRAVGAASISYYVLKNDTAAPTFKEIAALAEKVRPTIPSDSDRAWAYAWGDYLYRNAGQDEVDYGKPEPEFRWAAYAAFAEASGDPTSVLGNP